MLKKLIKEVTPSPLLHLLYRLYKIAIFRTRPRRVVPDRALSSLRVMIAYNRFGGYCLPLNSIQRPALQAVMRGAVWEEETVEFMRHNCSGGDIVHAGTYFGDFLPGISGACEDDAIIWAFEPNSENYRCAEITCRINNLTNVKLFNAGLGQTDSRGVMNTVDVKGRSMGGSSTIVDSSSDLDFGQTETVQIVSLDAVVPDSRNVSLLQLDIEGYEKYALLGALNLIKRCSPILLLENPLPENEWLEEHIFPLGYSVVGEVQGNSVLRNVSL